VRTPGLALLGLLLGLPLACGPRSPEHVERAAPTHEPGPREEQPVRVLITGFNDWHDIHDARELWRCRDNPSCRLLIGDAASEEPRAFEGPLATRLRSAAPQVEWTFRTMPVTWGVFAEPPPGFDVIINIGLGVYDTDDALQLERGAYNLHEGLDAAQAAASGPIDASAAEVVLPSAALLDRIDALAGRELAGYRVRVAAARPDNSYLCNETHFFALAAQARSGSPRAVYFLHIPQPRAEGGFEALGEAVAQLVLELVR
jgi:hypothetical protein